MKKPRGLKRWFLRKAFREGDFPPLSDNEPRLHSAVSNFEDERTQGAGGGGAVEPVALHRHGRPNALRLQQPAWLAGLQHGQNERPSGESCVSSSSPPPPPRTPKGSSGRPDPSRGFRGVCLRLLLTAARWRC